MNLETQLDRFEGSADQWYDGDFLVHSAASADAESTVSVPLLRQAGEAAGLDFVVLMDHTNSTGSLNLAAAADLPCSYLAARDERIRCIETPDRWNLGDELPWWQQSGFGHAAGAAVLPGYQITLEALNESTTPTTDSRTGCFLQRGLWSTNHPEFAVRDRPTGADLGPKAAAQCRSLGGLLIRIPWRGLRTDGLVETYNGILIMDGRKGFSEEDTAAVLGYLDRISRGQRPAALGGSGSHEAMRQDGEVSRSPVGSMRTRVLASALTDGAIYDAVAAGHTVAHTKNSWLDVRIYSDQGAYLGTIGDEIRYNRNPMVMRIRSGSSQRLQLFLIRFLTGDTSHPGAVEKTETLDFKCNSNGCSAEFSLAIPSNAAAAWVAIAAPRPFWKENDPETLSLETLPMEEVAIASPVYFVP